jgi:hypothetical protein
MPDPSTPNRRRSGKRSPGGTSAEAPRIVNHNGPGEAEIRQRAHEIYLNRAGGYGDSLGDWLLAELELRTRAGQSLMGDPS